MRRIVSIGIKALVSFALLYAILGFGYNMSFGRVVLITIVLGAISYIVGDLIILPRTNNVVATAVDLGIAFSVIWGLNAYSLNNHTLLLYFSSLIGALGITVFEYFFHIYLLKAFIHEKQTYYYSPTRNRYHMESSKELHPELDRDNKRDPDKK